MSNQDKKKQPDDFDDLFNFNTDDYDDQFEKVKDIGKLANDAEKSNPGIKKNLLDIL